MSALSWALIKTLAGREEGPAVMAVLARLFRERRDYPTAFCLASAAISGGVDGADMQTELSISGFYMDDGIDRARGHAACEALSLSREVLYDVRERARENLYFYIQPLPASIASWKTIQLTLPAPRGWFPSNPAVALHKGELLVAQRFVNYWLDQRGTQTDFWTPALSRTFLSSIDPETLEDKVIGELTWEAPPPVNGRQFIGFEDARIFSWQGGLWCINTVCNQNREGYPEQWFGRIDGRHLVDNHRLNSGGWRIPQKNWMPLVDGDRLRFIYLCDPTRILDETGFLVSEEVPRIACEHFRGSSVALPFEDGFLAVVHVYVRQNGWLKTHHRFVWFDKEYRLARISAAWCLPEPETDIASLKGYQYVMSLAWHPDGKTLIMGYQLGERESWLASFSAADLGRMLRSV